MKTPKHILPIIVISQFCGTSLWFSGNAIITSLIETFDLTKNALGHLTIAVQLGFIIGTIIFALLAFADRFSPSKVFMVSAIIAAIFNLGIIWSGNTFFTLLIWRFCTGFFLAGIYPVGMKIAADYYEKGLGKSLGFLVGALVLGTAFPHLVNVFFDGLPFKQVLISTSIIAAIGGVLLYFTIPNGPYRKQGQPFEINKFKSVFNNKPFRQATWGYIGHMWELYTFWAIVPLILESYNINHSKNTINISLASFCIIAIGTFACIASGHISEKIGVKKTAFYALLSSCICCIIAPLLFEIASTYIIIIFLCFWGIVVIADSPLLSTLVAQNAPPSIRGTAITIVTSIGFAVTIISIQLINSLNETYLIQYLLPILSIGPIIGLYKLSKKDKTC